MDNDVKHPDAVIEKGQWAARDLVVDRYAIDPADPAADPTANLDAEPPNATADATADARDAEGPPTPATEPPPTSRPTEDAPTSEPDATQVPIPAAAPRPAEVWLVAGDPSVYREPADFDQSAKIVAAFLDRADRVTLAMSGPLNDEQMDEARLLVQPENDDTAYRVRAVVSTDAYPDATEAGRTMYEVLLDRPVRPEHLGRLRLDLPMIPTGLVIARYALDHPRYTPLEATLGPKYTAQATTFRTWCPVATAVAVLLYDNIGDEQPSAVVPLDRGDKGLWETTIAGDLHARPYRYRFHSYGEDRETVDIHAVAADHDSAYALVVDFTRLNPDRWTDDHPPRLEQPTEEIIYEVHVRDYSIHDESQPAEQRGTFLGLTHENPGDDDNPSTGVSHLLDLGVTAVHLLPIQDYTAQVGEYNWGYWTALFNVPEANYATDPHDPMRPIHEFKAAVAGLHAKGLRVIMDVAYNHTSSCYHWSPFENTVPFYYFRTTADGRLRNDAGVGNSLADEKPMVRKYIVDSLKHWAGEYHVDGFRFDLLGTHRFETVQAICETLLDQRPDLTLYGEPWTGGGPTYFPKGAQRGMRMAVFNDHYRQLIRGDLDGTGTGFATGPGGDAWHVVSGISGSIDDFTMSPVETVNYASAHDNLALWDKLVRTHPNDDDDARRAMLKLALGMILTSQGIAFLHGGCDFARTKQGHHNTYNAPTRSTPSTGPAERSSSSTCIATSPG